MSDTLTLRIKKEFYDLIKTGRKTVEYRSMTPYYTSRLAEPFPTKIVLHYQGYTRLHCEVQKVEKITRPSWLEKRYVTTQTCYAITLKPVKETKSAASAASK